MRDRVQSPAFALRGRHSRKAVGFRSRYDFQLAEVDADCFVQLEKILGRKYLVEEFPAAAVHSRELPILSNSSGKIEEAYVIPLIWAVEPLRADLASGWTVEDLGRLRLRHVVEIPE